MRFVTPQDEMTKPFSIGDYIKIGIYVGDSPPIAERFWIKVIEKRGHQVSGVVDNQLLFEEKHGFNLGDTISIPSAVVLDILKA